MKRRIVVWSVLPLLVLTLAGVAQAWQGRMGGMGDPYGLVQDESDFLYHPSKIAAGEGVRFYGDYRFTYTDVMDWDYNVDVFLAGSTFLIRFFRYDTSGDEQRHDALVGTAVPLGPGRLGLFFSYEGLQGDYDGDVQSALSPPTDAYELTSDLDAFTLRLLYGLPLGSLNFGGEFQFSYHQEENASQLLQQSILPSWLTNIDGSFSNVLGGNKNFLAFMMPYDSDYLEALFKGSLDAVIGPVEATVTVRGGFIFNGGNQLDRVGRLNLYDLDGEVEGWRVGGDLWLRYALTDDLAIPFLVRIDYQKKTRDGDGILAGLLAGAPIDYDSTEKSLELEVGGGVNTELATGKRLAAGIYYSYHNADDDFWMSTPAIPFLGSPLFSDYSKYPSLIEHRIRLALVGEWDISPAVTLRMGMEPFYGWITEDFESRNFGILFFNRWNEAVSLDGHRWGIGASMGATVQLQHLTLEPFVGFGYQEINLDGDGTELLSLFGLGVTMDVDEWKREWCIGGGVSVLFDLP
jgi:hypothetical protein